MLNHHHHHPPHPHPPLTHHFLSHKTSISRPAWRRWRARARAVRPWRRKYRLGGGTFRTLVQLNCTCGQQICSMAMLNNQRVTYVYIYILYSI